LQLADVFLHVTNDFSSDNQIRRSTQRRSRRLYVQIKVRVEWSLEDKTLIAEDTQTFVVNAHGGLVRLVSVPPLGQKVALQNTYTYETQESVVAFVSKEVAEDGRYDVGVEFTNPNASFWNVSFPPEDWSPTYPDTKA
jgi:hypothetical protein